MNFFFLQKMETVTDQEIFLGYCENNSILLLTEFIKTRALDLHEGLRVAVLHNSHEAANIIKNYVTGQKADYNLDIDMKFLEYCYNGDIRAIDLIHDNNVNVRIGALISNRRGHRILSYVIKRYLKMDFLKNTKPIIRAAVKAFNVELLQLIIAGGIQVTLDHGKTSKEKKFIMSLIY